VSSTNGGIPTPKHFSRTRQPVTTAHTLPPECFSSQAFYQWEVEQFFHGSWHCVGRTDQQPESGDYRVVEIAGASIIIIREKKGQLRAMANVCRHRNTRLLSGEGRLKHIRCPFHSWTYGVGGDLIGAPGMDRTADFDPAEYSLAPVRLENHSGFVFVNIDGHARDLSELLGDFHDLHKPYGLEELVSTRRARFDVACNWKLFLQVFMEYYHLSTVHPETLRETQYQPPDEDTFGTGEYISQFGTHQGTGALLQGTGQRSFEPIATLEGRLLNGSRYTQIFPSTIFACTRDCMWYFECYPDGPNRTTFYMNSCFPRVTVERADFGEIAAGYYDRWDIALREDIDILERQHLGMASPHAQPGRYSHLESGVGHFERWIAQQIES
jgi:phenylpropionate dioxygenase-like ring-hydroxylating dioxygenase large terminal subunit